MTVLTVLVGRNRDCPEASWRRGDASVADCCESFLKERTGLAILAGVHWATLFVLGSALPGCGGKNTPGVEIQHREQAIVGAMCERLTACAVADARQKLGIEEEELARLGPEITAECALTYGAGQLTPRQAITVQDCTTEVDSFPDRRTSSCAKPDGGSSLDPTPRCAEIALKKPPIHPENQRHQDPDATKPPGALPSGIAAEATVIQGRSGRRIAA